MKRDPATGRFVKASAHRYRLTYDSGAPEYVTALTPSEAVRARTTLALPHTITDESAVKAWVDGMAHKAHTTPMLTRMYGEPIEQADDGWDRPAQTFYGGGR